MQIKNTMTWKSTQGLLIAVLSLLLIPCSAPAADAATTKTMLAKRTLNIGVVNFKECIEQSKLGKQEQASFESMKKQMESILEEKEKTLSDIANKFNDPDYLDSLAPEAETELKRKFRALSQEITQQQNQYYQTLSQANYKVIQKLNDMITKAAEEVAKERNFDLILNEESCFYSSAELDLSPAIVSKMDASFEKEAKEKIETSTKGSSEQKKSSKE